MLDRARELLLRQRTMLVNAVRAHLTEFGIVAPVGIANVDRLFARLEGTDAVAVPDLAREVLAVLRSQLEMLRAKLQELDQRLMAWHRSNETSRRLATIPGIGPITATALVATVSDAWHFQTARRFSAWIGLVPRQHSSGGKDRLGAISLSPLRNWDRVDSIG